MSSSSSSECDCSECCYYAFHQDRNFGRKAGYEGTPFYPTMGQPLVYYTQVQQPPMRRQKSKDSGKRNPNCFVKAFRWYTQELVPPPQRSYQGNRRMNGFATWLDSKYDEFLKEGQLDRSLLHLKLKQTSLLEVDAIPKTVVLEPKTTKRVNGMRSPWKKRRRQRSIEGGDTLGKSTQSFEFILRPKDLLRPASESYHVTPSSNCNPSSTTIIKHSYKSQSLTNIRQDTDNKKEPPPKIIVVHEGSKIRKRKEQQQAMNAKPKMNASKMDVSNLRYKDAACQCFEDSVINAKTGTQYESNNLLTSPKQFSPTKASKIPHNKVHKEYYNDSCQCSKEYVHKLDANNKYQQQYNNNDGSQIIGGRKQENHKPASPIRPTKTDKATSDIKTADSYAIRKHQGCHTRDTERQKVFINYGVQTSDCSISLVKNSVGYPLFMKIIRADKFDEESKSRPLK